LHPAAHVVVSERHAGVAFGRRLGLGADQAVFGVVGVGHAVGGILQIAVRIVAGCKGIRAADTGVLVEFVGAVVGGRTGGNGPGAVADGIAQVAV